jgi:hypothetical protein
MNKLWHFVAALGVILLSVAKVEAQTMTTAFLTGEQTTGMTKQCYYEALGSRYTRTVASTQVCAVSIRVPVSPGRPSEPQRTPATVTAFLTGEQTTGNTKQCYYEALGSRYTETVASYAICRQTIQVRPRP